MTNPLVTLDQAVLQQHDKVANVAHKKLGWNKYDLARLTDNINH